MLLNIGTDIVNIGRIASLLSKQPSALPGRILHPKERLIFDKLIPSKQTSYLAKRFAAKEAFAKALGTGIGPDGLRFKDIIVLNEDCGKPTITLESNHSAKLNSANAMVSIADEQDYAVAFVVISKLSTV